jgi:hypothetical protein
VIELGEQSLTDTLTCSVAPDRNCVIAATPRADSVPSGPAWPTAKMVAPAYGASASPRGSLICYLPGSFPLESK